MLVGDKQRTVRLFADNILWGRVKISDLVDRVDKYSIHSAITKDKLQQWFKMEQDVEEAGLEEEFAKLTDEIYDSLVDGRIKGYVEGVMIDVDLEAELKQCKEDNERLSEQLQTAYIPPSDPKVGTN